MSPLKLVGRGLAVLVIDSLALVLLAALLSRFTLDSFSAAVLVALILGVLNALVWPTLSRLTVPLSVLTLGFASLLLNAVLVGFAIDLVPGASIAGFSTAVAVTIGISLLTVLTSSLLAIDDDESWYRNVVRSRSRKAKAADPAAGDDAPGVLFLEIDGLAKEVLERAIIAGNAPTIARWLAEGTHDLHGWETDWSSQTGACQAGLLHGNNHDMPAFRWWEKDRNAPIVTNHPKDAAEIERRQSDGKGLLHAGGASRANILSGDATLSMLTMSTVLTRRRPIGRDYATYFARPYAVVKTFGAVVAEYARERRAASAQRRHGIEPRIHRDRIYAVVRAWATVIQLDLQVAAVVGDLLAGRPVVYTTFLAYDEVAHHSGVERADTLAVLAKVDRQIGRIEAALAEAPRPYELVVLSDHGQSQGATFLQRYGLTLEALVEEACESDDTWVEMGGSAEAGAYIGAGLTELSREPGAVSGAVQSAGRRLAEPGTIDDERRAGSRGAGAGGDGLRMSRLDLIPARTWARHARADQRASSATDRHAEEPSRHRLRRSSRRRNGGRSRWARRAPISSSGMRSRASTRSRVTARTWSRTSSAPTGSRIAPTSSSTAPSGTGRRSLPSRSSSARTGASAARRAIPSCAPPPASPGPMGRWSAPRPSTGSSRAG